MKKFSSVHFTLAFLPLDVKPSTNSVGPKALSTSALESSLMLAGLPSALEKWSHKDYTEVITIRHVYLWSSVWHERHVLHPTKKNPVNRPLLSIQVELGLQARNNSSHAEQTEDSQRSRLWCDWGFSGPVASSVFTRAKKQEWGVYLWLCGTLCCYKTYSH